MKADENNVEPYDAAHLAAAMSDQPPAASVSPLSEVHAEPKRVGCSEVVGLPTPPPSHPDDSAREDWDEGDFEDDPVDEDEEWFDCGMIVDNRGRPIGCWLAGSEECDFSCPDRNWLYASLAKRAAKQPNTSDQPRPLSGR